MQRNWTEKTDGFGIRCEIQLRPATSDLRPQPSEAPAVARSVRGKHAHQAGSARSRLSANILVASRAPACAKSHTALAAPLRVSPVPRRGVRQHVTYHAARAATATAVITTLALAAGPARPEAEVVARLGRVGEAGEHAGHGIAAALAASKV